MKKDKGKCLNPSADKILSMLAIKHSGDIFIPECKDGSTWYSTHKRLDAWVMPRSWVHLKFIGYEIKVSRSDFLKDDKYQEYMKLCNEFYFVTAKGVCDKNEIPNNVGLLELSAIGSRLFTRKKATYREIEFPQNLFIYILMCRAKIAKDYSDYEESNTDYWKKWLKNKNVNFDLGRSVSKKLRKDYNKNIEIVRNENEELQKHIKNYDEFKSLLTEMGITNKDSYWEAYNKIQVLRKNIGLDIIQKELQRMKNNIEGTLQTLEMYKSQ